MYLIPLTGLTVCNNLWMGDVWRSLSQLPSLSIHCWPEGSVTLVLTHPDTHSPIHLCCSSVLPLFSSYVCISPPSSPSLSLSFPLSFFLSLFLPLSLSLSLYPAHMHTYTHKHITAVPLSSIFSFCEIRAAVHRVPTFQEKESDPASEHVTSSRGTIDSKQSWY